MMTNFTLLGFSERPELQIFLFVLCLGTYFMTLAWNLGLIVLIRMEPQLHSPMDFFVGNLSFVDISYTSSVAPKMLCDFFKDKDHKTISFVSCAAQFFFFIGMGGTECCLLAAMAYDLVCCHLRPSALHQHHVPHPLCGDGHYSIRWCMSHGIGPNHFHIPAPFL